MSRAYLDITGQPLRVERSDAGPGLFIVAGSALDIRVSDDQLAELHSLTKPAGSES